LSRSNFKSSIIGLTFFHLCSLDESDFTAATLYHNAFGDVSLRNVRGLDEIHDSFHNSIGIDTFFRSEGLPESFLRGSGIPENFIQYAASLV
jgi:hypothetical protein